MSDLPTENKIMLYLALIIISYFAANIIVSVYNVT